MTRVIFVVILIVLLSTPAAAEPPAGFSEFAWGTSPTVIREQFVPKRCRSTSESRRAWYSVECRDYQVEGLKIPILRLDFEPADSLAGYYMIVARGSYRPLRDLVLQRFGQPTSRGTFPWYGGGQMSWTWTGVTATLIERCGADYSCVEVKTTAIDKRLEQIRERERRDSMQSF